MKNRRNYRLLNACLAILILTTFLYLLTLTEKSRPGATIRTPFDALWYFLTTITTVGYGDISPITPFGKFLGGIIVILSCGFISFLITATIRLMNSPSVLGLRIVLAHADRWYIFDSGSYESRLLARQLCDQSENAGIIFCGSAARTRGLFRFRNILTALSVSDTLRICTEYSDGSSVSPPLVFLMAEDEDENLKTGLEIVSQTDKDRYARIYCRTSVRFQYPPKGLRTFDPTELTARTYWSGYPLTCHEKNIVLVGNGSLLNYMIEQAVLVNVFGPLLRCCYHIFDDGNPSPSVSCHTDPFLADHPHIRDVLSVQSEEDGSITRDRSDCRMSALSPGEPAEADAPGETDSLCFYREAWTENHSILMKADRIIICTTSEIRNIRIAEKIRLLLATQAQIHIYGSDSINGVTGFGRPDELFRPEHILRGALLEQARILNDYYNSLQNDVSKRTAWEDLSAFAQRSNMAAADHMGTKLRILTDSLHESAPASADPGTVQLALKNFRENTIDRNLCRRIEHERWMRFQAMYGWTYGEVRDNAQRKHPMMVPFEELTPEQQVLDDISWELIETLTGSSPASK